MSDQVGGAAQRAMDLAGIEQKIRELHQESEQLEARLTDQSNYQTQDGKFDSWAYKQDEIRVQRNTRRIIELQSQRGDVEKQSGQWQQFAQKKAVDYLRGNMSHIDEDIREEVKRIFTEEWQAAVNQGMFQRPDMQSSEAVQGLIEDRFTFALGQATNKRMRERGQGDRSGAPPSERGLDDRSGEGQEGEEPEDQFGDDDQARQWTKQFIERKEQKPKTLHEVQQERFQQLRDQQGKGGESS